MRISKKRYCDIHGIKYSKIMNRMRYKKMTFEEAINYKSHKDIFKPIMEKAIKLGLSVNTIRYRFNKGLRGEELFAPVKKRGKNFYKYMYDGKPFIDIVSKSSYYWFIRNKKNYKNLRIAMINAIERGNNE